MNGVLRFLGGGVPPPPPPPRPPAPPAHTPPHDSLPASPTSGTAANGTPGLVIRKERTRSSQAVPSHTVTSPTHVPIPNLGSPTSLPPESSTGWKRTSGLVNIRDELLMSLLTSEAVVDSRECEILSAEEVEELKKEHHVLKIRLTATQKKLELETKIRDAALSLSKVNATHRKVSRQTEEQLETAERKVVTAQKELWRMSERTNEVYHKLLEHRAGVLGYSVHKMEKKILPSLNGVSGTDPSRAMTPVRHSTMSSLASPTSTPSKFDGAHLFAGHADAQIPKAPLSTADIATLEANLHAATESLNAANKKNAELARELSHLRLEKEQLETTMSMELQNAEDTVSAFEKELPRFEDLQARCDELTREHAQWEEDRKLLAAREREVERLERRLEVLEEKSGAATEMERTLASIREKADTDVRRKDEALSDLQLEYENARAHWQAERAVMEDELDRLRGGGEARSELDGAIETLHVVMQLHRVDHKSRDTSVQGLLASVGTHLDNLTAIITEQGNSREQLVSQLEASRRERDDAKREALALGTRVKELTTPSIYNGPPIEYKGEVADVVALLQPIWAVLPAPELRSAKLGPPRHLRVVSSASNPGSAHSRFGLPSLSDMDIRALKTLYDPKSPQAAVGGAFSLEAFVARVQALVIDDRTLIERLIRFAQAHDLLKKNAERAQKLAEDSNAALEMYQMQVATLDDQNVTLQERQAALMDEMQELQAAVDLAVAERRDVERHAADQAETCRQLTEVNNTLSAKTLALAQEVVSAPEMVRKQLESQLDECQRALREAQEEVEAMRASEQTQRIALLDELNSTQTENANLRAQLRALKK